MTLWIPITLAAATVQTVRFVLQKHQARVALSAVGATFARFFYSAPLIAVLTILYLHLRGVEIPELSALFWGFAVVGGVVQILATVCMMVLFKQRNFAVGMTFMKTEVLMTVLVGWLVLGDRVSLAGFGAICIGVVGVLLLSDPPGGQGRWLRRIGNRSVALGLGAGLMFAMSAVSYRGASLEIVSSDPLVRASVTLSVVTGMQMIGLGLWLWRREVGQIGAVWRARRVAGWIGLTSMLGSMGWFTAFTLQNAAYVKALAQVDLILSLLASALFFKESIASREVIGIAVLAGSIVALVASV